MIRAGERIMSFYSLGLRSFAGQPADNLDQRVVQPIATGTGFQHQRDHSVDQTMLAPLDEKPSEPQHSQSSPPKQQKESTPGLTLFVRLYKLNITTLHRNQDHAPLAMNDLARVSLQTDTPLFYDSYKKYRQTGAIILMDESDNTTVAAGMLL
jgi:hypothetical protein